MPPVELKNNRLPSGRGVLTGVLLNALGRGVCVLVDSGGLCIDDGVFIVVVDLLFN